MAIFRCLRSGNTVSLTRQDDIDRIRKQENYVEVVHESKTDQGGDPSGRPKENDAHEEGKRSANEENGVHDQTQGQNVLKKRGRGRPKN